MQKHKDVRFSNNFINLTDRVIHLYEDTDGDIVSFPPSNKQLSDSPAIVEPNAPVVHYIVDTYSLARLQERGRHCTDIAVFDHEGHGRQGVLIADLYWGADPNIKVHLRRHDHSNSSHHL